MRMILLAASYSVVVACSATGTMLSEPNSAETAIPFVRSGGILEWRAARDGALYIRANSGDWYFVRTQGPCTRLAVANTLGFVTNAGDQLDRHGAILAQGQRCPVSSVVRSGPPSLADK